MILLDDRCIEMQRGKDDQVARPLFEHLVQIPDLEMMAHADQQRALSDTATRAHPRRDRDPAFTVHMCWRDETQSPPQQSIACSAFPVCSNFAVMIYYAGTIIDEHAWIIRVKTDEQVFAHATRLYRDAELLGKHQFAARTDRRHRTSYEKLVHMLTPSTQARTTPRPSLMIQRRRHQQATDVMVMKR